MKSFVSGSLARLYLRLNIPIVTLVALLQRSPVLRWIASDADALRPLDGAGGFVLKASLTAAALGAVDTLAGATAYVLTTTAHSPLASTAGTAITPVGFTVNPTQNIGSWDIVGPIPPGLVFSAQEGGNTLTGNGGVLDATTQGSSDGYGGMTGGNSMTTPILTGTPTTAGTYTMSLTAYEYGSLGGLVSPTFQFTVVVTAAGPPPPPLPAFQQQPQSFTVESGGTAVLNGTASNAASYQWMLNGSAVSGATQPRLVLANVTASAGPYTLVATNSTGSTTSSPATVSVSTDPQFGHLVNLSVLTLAGSSHVVTLGFYNSGPSPEPVLVRATGPALTGFGVSNVLPDPTLNIIPAGGSTPLASNDNWGTPSSNIAAVDAADSATGAFALNDIASLDAALAITLPVGGYTVQVSGNGSAAGQALAEVYDNTSGTFSASTTRLVNLSCLDSMIGSGSLTAGFYLHGNTARTVLVRATGPALTGFGVSGVMPDPQITLVSTANNSGTTIATNAGWGGDSQITSVSNTVHAFALTDAQSHDAVILVTLPPGGYTATASSASGAGGNVLVEIYEVQ